MTSFPDTAAAAPGASAPPTTSRPLDKLYFAAWRWHFYAGLVAIPVILMLAVTGFAMMILTTVLPEYGDRLAVTPAGQVLPVEEQVTRAIAAVPGGTAVKSYATALSPANPVLVTISGPETPVVVALDPFTGEALRQTAEGATWAAWLQTLHGSLFLGTFGDRVIEIAAGLGFVVLATGLYLWWPRADRGWRDLLVPRLTARGRAFWKSLHMVTGFWVSAGLLAFLLTGMAWTGVWGEKWVQAWSTFPAEKYGAPLSEATHASLNVEGEKRVPWGLEQAPLPASGSQAGVPAEEIAPKPHHGGESDMAGMAGMDHAMMDHGTTESRPPSLATMLALGDELGLSGQGRFRVVAPEGETGVWSLLQESMSYDGVSPTADRTVHVDRYTGNIRADIGFADYSLPAKAMAAGVALHEGQAGLWNLLLNTLVLALVILLCVSGVVVWWKRRPQGAWRLAAPPRSEELPVWRGALALALGLSMLFPLVGATLIAVLVLDILVLQNIGPLRRALS